MSRGPQVDQLLDVVSHELRSPLNGIKSWAHVLQKHAHESDDPTLERAIAGIMTGVEQQVRLIEDLLDLSRALAGNLGLVTGPMAIAPAILEAVEGLRAVAAEKGVQLVVDPAIADARIHGDPGRIHQIVSNLVGNAINLTPAHGTVHVASSVDGGMVCVEVRDNGAGIPAEVLPHVFDLGGTEQSTGTHRQRGPGLGLALAQRLAELHGGRATCESDGRNRGATFRVYIPMEGTMADKKRTHTNEQDQSRTRDDEHPQRPEPDTLEGPGGRHDAKGEQDALNKTTRRGER